MGRGGVQLAFKASRRRENRAERDSSASLNAPVARFTSGANSSLFAFAYQGEYCLAPGTKRKASPSALRSIAKCPGDAAPQERRPAKMCWVCERLESLIAGWNEERVFQEEASGNEYHRGLSKGFHECVRDLSEAVASMRLKGLCEKLPESPIPLNDSQRSDIVNDLLNLRDPDINQE